jgi:glutathione S-transferase
MSDLRLIIGNKNYSSWSLRPWILLKHLGLPFSETLLPLDQPAFKDQVEQYSPSGRLPVLLHGGLAIWDSLAICEYLAELTGRGWPVEREARAVARSVAAEMHSGFGNLRAEWPFNARQRNKHTPMTPGLQADMDRVEEIWTDCRSRFGKDQGPWLFGEYSAADAMYAPVVSRFNTYGAPLTEVSRWYMAAALEDPAMQEWLVAARSEPWIIEKSEIG